MASFAFQALPAGSGAAGSYVDAPWRVMFHTTETTADPRSWVPGWISPSHIVADYERDLVIECIALDQAAKALWNEPGGVETNRQRCIQVELNGRADDAGSWPDAKLRWIATAVLVPIVKWIRAQGGDIDLTDVPEPGPHANSARVDAPQRMAFPRWNTFNGVCGHRHAPENDHYDADQLDMRAIATYAAAELGTPTHPATAPVTPAPAPQEDNDDMLNAYKLPDGDTIFVRNPFTGKVRNLEDITPKGEDPITTLDGMVAASMCRPLVTLGWNPNWAVAVMDGRA